MSRGLWITRHLPFPADSGDRIYSAQLIQATARAGADLTVVGFAPPQGTTAPDWPVRWVTVPGQPHGTARALWSALPLVAAAHATPAYRQAIDHLAAERWDFVVFDQYGTGWAMAPFLAPGTSGHRPVRVHVSHDHEASLYASLARDFRGGALRRLGLWQNALKTARLERRIARSVDLVTAITEEDAALFHADAPATSTIVLTPGYQGPVGARTQLAESVPRRVLVVGSFHWIAKAENLRRFIEAADPAFAQAGIELHVVGSMPQALAQEIRQRTRATVLHGFVHDIAPHLAAARIGVVAEAIGGGFKLKFLDYVFGRLPVATLEQAAAGLPPALKTHMLRARDMRQLVQRIVLAMDDVTRLDALQQQAFVTAQPLFRWQDRGQALLAAVQAQGRGRRQPAALARCEA